MRRPVLTRALVIVGAIGGSPAVAADAPAEEAQRPMSSVFDQPPYPGIAVLSREKGDAGWWAAIPDSWRRLREIIAGEPAQVKVRFYSYEGDEGPSQQNFYRSYQALDCGDGRYVAVSMCTRGLGDTAEGFLDHKMWYRLSFDGGETYDEERPMVELGEAYSCMHPTRHVWVGKNSFSYGGIPPLTRMSNGELIMPCQLAPLDAHFRYYNPTGRFTFSMVAMVIGRWNEAGDDIVWESSEKILPSAEQSWRGFDEAGVLELRKPGRIFCVLRAGDGHQWRALSTDYGRTWSAHDHLTYSNGEEFWTPSSCMAIFRHSRTGRAYWIGNISRVDPKGTNSPRYPLVIAEVDEEALGLQKETVTIVDDRGPDDPPGLQLSNFRLVEEARTGNIVITLNRTDYDEPETETEGIHTYVIQVK